MSTTTFEKDGIAGYVFQSLGVYIGSNIVAASIVKRSDIIKRAELFEREYMVPNSVLTKWWNKYIKSGLGLFSANKKLLSYGPIAQLEEPPAHNR